MMDNELDRLRQFGKQMQGKNEEKIQSVSFLLLLGKWLKSIPKNSLSFVGKIRNNSVLLNRAVKKVFRGVRSKLRDIDLMLHIWVWEHEIIEPRVKKAQVTRYYLKEIRKQKGNTSVIIRKRIPLDDAFEKHDRVSSASSMMYYVHGKTKEKTMFHPQASIWDFPVKPKKQSIQQFFAWFYK